MSSPGSQCLCPGLVNSTRFSDALEAGKKINSAPHATEMCHMFFCRRGVRSEGLKRDGNQRFSKGTTSKQTPQPPEEINIPATRPRRPRARAPPRERSQGPRGHSPAPGQPRPPSSLGRGTWAPRPGSLTRTRSAARSRDAPVRACVRAAGQGHGVPGPGAGRSGAPA